MTKHLQRDGPSRGASQLTGNRSPWKQHNSRVMSRSALGRVQLGLLGSLLATDDDATGQLSTLSRLAAEAQRLAVPQPVPDGWTRKTPPTPFLHQGHMPVPVPTTLMQAQPWLLPKRAGPVDRATPTHSRLRPADVRKEPKRAGPVDRATPTHSRLRPADVRYHKLQINPPKRNQIALKSRNANTTARPEIAKWLPSMNDAHRNIHHYTSSQGNSVFQAIQGNSKSGDEVSEALKPDASNGRAMVQNQSDSTTNRSPHIMRGNSTNSSANRLSLPAIQNIFPPTVALTQRPYHVGAKNGDLYGQTMQYSESGQASSNEYQSNINRSDHLNQQSATGTHRAQHTSPMAAPDGTTRFHANYTNRLLSILSAVIQMLNTTGRLRLPRMPNLTSANRESTEQSVRHTVYDQLSSSTSRQIRTHNSDGGQSMKNMSAELKKNSSPQPTTPTAIHSKQLNVITSTKQRKPNQQPSPQKMTHDDTQVSPTYNQWSNGGPPPTIGMLSTFPSVGRHGHHTNGVWFATATSLPTICPTPDREKDHMPRGRQRSTATGHRHTQAPKKTSTTPLVCQLLERQVRRPDVNMDRRIIMSRMPNFVAENATLRHKYIKMAAMAKSKAMAARSKDERAKTVMSRQIFNNAFSNTNRNPTSSSSSMISELRMPPINLRPMKSAKSENTRLHSSRKNTKLPTTHLGGNFQNRPAFINDGNSKTRNPNRRPKTMMLPQTINQATPIPRYPGSSHSMDVQHHNTTLEPGLTFTMSLPASEIRNHRPPTMHALLRPMARATIGLRGSTTPGLSCFKSTLYNTLTTDPLSYRMTADGPNSKRSYFKRPDGGPTILIQELTPGYFSGNVDLTSLGPSGTSGLIPVALFTWMFETGSIPSTWQQAVKVVLAKYANDARTPLQCDYGNRGEAVTQQPQWTRSVKSFTINSLSNIEERNGKTQHINVIAVTQNSTFAYYQQEGRPQRRKSISDSLIEAPANIKDHQKNNSRMTKEITDNHSLSQSGYQINDLNKLKPKRQQIELPTKISKGTKHLSTEREYLSVTPLTYVRQPSTTDGDKRSPNQERNVKSTMSPKFDKLLPLAATQTPSDNQMRSPEYVFSSSHLTSNEMKEHVEADEPKRHNTTLVPNHQVTRLQAVARQPNHKNAIISLPLSVQQSQYRGLRLETNISISDQKPSPVNTTHQSATAGKLTNRENPLSGGRQHTVVRFVGTHLPHPTVAVPVLTVEAEHWQRSVNEHLSRLSPTDHHDQAQEKVTRTNQSHLNKVSGIQRVIQSRAPSKTVKTNATRTTFTAKDNIVNGSSHTTHKNATNNADNKSANFSFINISSAKHLSQGLPYRIANPLNPLRMFLFQNGSSVPVRHDNHATLPYPDTLTGGVPYRSQSDEAQKTAAESSSRWHTTDNRAENPQSFSGINYYGKMHKAINTENEGAEKTNNATNGIVQKTKNTNNGGIQKTIYANNGGVQKTVYANDGGGQKKIYKKNGGVQKTIYANNGGQKTIYANNGGGKNTINRNNGGVQKTPKTILLKLFPLDVIASHNKSYVNVHTILPISDTFDWSHLIKPFSHRLRSYVANSVHSNTIYRSPTTTTTTTSLLKHAERGNTSTNGKMTHSAVDKDETDATNSTPFQSLTTRNKYFTAIATSSSTTVQRSEKAVERETSQHPIKAGNRQNLKEETYTQRHQTPSASLKWNNAAPLNAKHTAASTGPPAPLTNVDTAHNRQSMFVPPIPAPYGIVSEHIYDHHKYDGGKAGIQQYSNSRILNMTAKEKRQNVSQRQTRQYVGRPKHSKYTLTNSKQNGTVSNNRHVIDNEVKKQEQSGGGVGYLTADRIFDHATNVEINSIRSLIPKASITNDLSKKRPTQPTRAQQMLIHDVGHVTSDSDLFRGRPNATTNSIRSGRQSEYKDVFARSNVPRTVNRPLVYNSIRKHTQPTTTDSATNRYSSTVTPDVPNHETWKQFGGEGDEFKKPYTDPMFAIHTDSDRSSVKNVVKHDKTRTENLAADLKQTKSENISMTHKWKYRNEISAHTGRRNALRDNNNRSENFQDFSKFFHTDDLRPIKGINKFSNLSSYKKQYQIPKEYSNKENISNLMNVNNNRHRTKLHFLSENVSTIAKDHIFEINLDRSQTPKDELIRNHQQTKLTPDNNSNLVSFRKGNQPIEMRHHIIDQSFSNKPREGFPQQTYKHQQLTESWHNLDQRKQGTGKRSETAHKTLQTNIKYQDITLRRLYNGTQLSVLQGHPKPILESHSEHRSSQKPTSQSKPRKPLQLGVPKRNSLQHISLPTLGTKEHKQFFDWLDNLYNPPPYQPPTAKTTASPLLCPRLQTVMCRPINGRRSNRMAALCEMKCDVMTATCDLSVCECICVPSVGHLFPHLSLYLTTKQSTTTPTITTIAAIASPPALTTRRLSEDEEEND